MASHAPSLIYVCILLLFIPELTLGGSPIAKPHPNIIFILADDWGLGDVKAYGGDRCKIDTPHMDALAAKGMKFTDAHTSSSVCTP